MEDKNDYLYKKVKLQLLDFVKDLPAGARIPSRIRLMEKFGVTRTTVERAISELIGEGVFSSRIGSGTYVLAAHERNAGKAPDNIPSWGLILPNITHDSYPETLRGVEDVCSKNGINLIICNTDDNVEKELMYLRKLIDSKISGVIIVPAIERTYDVREIFTLLREKMIGFVLCNRGIEGINAIKVSSNDFYGGMLATNHLLDLGWKRPAYISAPLYSISEQRYQGYLSALHEHGVPERKDLIIFEDRFVLENRGYNAMKTMLDLPAPPDSVFCFDDTLAEGVYQAITEKGLTVGKDIGLVGYNDTHNCERLPVKLTSVRFPKYEIGQKSAEILLSIMKGEEPGKTRSFIFHPSLIIRESCGSKGIQ